jgi:homocysteine S-methyltransferase
MKKVNIFSIAKRINRPLILDGAIGSILEQKFPMENDIQTWMTKINTEHPEVLFSLYKDYITAGADIITTNTFRTNPISLKYQSLSYNITDLIKRTVDLAFLARANSSVLIAGSNPPAEDCYQDERTVSYDELMNNHHKHIDLLLNSGVDFILNETQSHFDEINIICKYCSWNNIPFIISLYVTDDLRILSGEALDDVLNFILQFKPLAIGFNCIKPEILFKIIEKYEMNFNWGAYLNILNQDSSSNNIETNVTPEQYQEIVKQILPYKPSFVGGCCGTNPEHIAKIRELFEWNI